MVTPALAFGVHCSVVKELLEARLAPWFGNGLRLVTVPGSGPPDPAGPARVRGPAGPPYDPPSPEFGGADSRDVWANSGGYTAGGPTATRGRRLLRLSLRAP